MCISASVLMAAATAVQAFGAIRQGKQAKRQARWQAAQAEADASAERQMAEVRAEKIRKGVRRQQSEARAALAASGVETSAGTAVTIDTDIARQGEEDAQMELLSGNYRGARLESEAAGQRTAGKNAQSASYLGAAGSLLEGGARIGKGWKASAGPYYDP